MSSPSTSLHYTAEHPPTERPNHPDATQVGQPASDPTSSSQQPSKRLTSSSYPPNTYDTQSSSNRPSAHFSSPAQNLSSSASLASDLPTLKSSLSAAITQYRDFPTPGILFEDILPLFSSPSLHAELITALELFISQNFSPEQRPDVVVGLEARGFLFAPTLALRLGAGFVPVRKPNKLPGRTEKAKFRKEYGEDSFHIQAHAIAKGQKVLVVDDILATGGSAAAAGELVEKVGGVLLGYVFILGLNFLNGKQKLEKPVHILLDTQKEEDVT